LGKKKNYNVRKVSLGAQGDGHYSAGAKVYKELTGKGWQEGVKTGSLVKNSGLVWTYHSERKKLQDGGSDKQVSSKKKTNNPPPLLKNCQKSKPRVDSRSLTPLRDPLKTSRRQRALAPGKNQTPIQTT